ncbi:methylated-DNA--[protein]-cysteine S-methyltransferase [Microbacterium azadirachtae]|uniref:Methylated-DNA--protein-cysteine methyltransferase n=1 Tax=Microbacterium azadirachtae TaxID=582680 RepID=A0A0F0LLA7_9MICO|nr:methylated-DNA--[protein]-cysteine S-methyltransferase [Microbacterium azadirachtae]KJL32301.1 Methylated-DNA--protein-cysteine methyltransferase [Microbacterium azadirachtae]
MTYSGSIATPVGVIAVHSDGVAITRVTWPRAGRSVASVPGESQDAERDPLLAEALAQLGAYFAGERSGFDLPFDLGPQSDVTNAVLHALYDTVGHGQTVTYGELAERSGTTVPARAIGAIMGANPIPIIVPCHRVVASDGLGGYSGGAPGEGLLTKRWLLEHEGALPTALF